MTNEVFYILFGTLSLQNPVCVLYLQHITNRTSHISRAQYHVWLVAMVLEVQG